MSVRILRPVFIVISLIVKHGDGVYKTACLEGGQATGEPLEDSFTDFTVAPHRMHLMRETGAINCFGVVTGWNFFKVGPCEEVVFSVWRGTEDDGSYLLVGTNTYDPKVEDCSNEDYGVISFKIRGNKQIPVQHGDAIGWSQTMGLMISASVENVSWVQLHSDQQGPVDPGTVVQFMQSRPMEIALQAVIDRSTLPLFSTLPREVEIVGGVKGDDDVYVVKAIHPGNIMPQRTSNAMNNVVDLAYSLGSHTDLYAIDETDGTVRTMTDVTYEPGDKHEVIVKASAMVMTSTSTLTVIVTNPPPKLTTSSPNAVDVSAIDKHKGDEIFRVAIQEYTGKNTVTFFVAETHASDPSNVHQTPPFFMEKDTGIVKCSMGLQQFKHSDDYPEQVTYTIRVVATDGVLVDSQRIDVRLLHLRQPPQISNLPNDYTILVREDIVPMTTIFQIEAETTYNEVISKFHLVNVDPIESTDSFYVDEKSGQIFVNGLLERKITYTLDVSAKDALNFTAYGVLRIDVTTVNQQPYFDPVSYNVSVPEKCNEVDTGGCVSLPWQIPSLVLYTFDRESTDLSCDNNPILPGFSFEYFAMSGPCNERIVNIIKEIDVDSYPELQHIELTVRVEDTGYQPIKSALGVVYLTFYDINDHAPEFEAENYTYTIEENIPGGVSLFTVQATDGDLTSPNNMVYYSIQKKTLGSLYFEVGQLDGTVRTKQPVDYETHRVISFEIVARDGGSPQKMSTVNVSIFIIDTNDNHPVIDCQDVDPLDPYPSNQDCFHNLEVRADKSPPHQILDLYASDDDSVTPDVFFFLLKPDTHFSISENNGTIKLVKELNGYQRHLLTCYARDNGEPDLLSIAQLVRVDSYPPETHLVDVTIEMPIAEFPSSASNFTVMMRQLLYPWIAKIDSYKEYLTKTKVTIYALVDNSTYYITNMRTYKRFVHRDALLGKLRKNIHGTPSDPLIEAGVEFNPIRVMPTFEIWWTDTVEGIATIFVLCLLFLLLVIGLIIIICWKAESFCFTKKPRAWVEKKEKKTMTEEPMRLNYMDGSTVRHRGTTSTPSEEDSGRGSADVTSLASTNRNASKEDYFDDEARGVSAVDLREETPQRPISTLSTDSIHSMIYHRKTMKN